MIHFSPSRCLFRILRVSVFGCTPLSPRGDLFFGDSLLRFVRFFFIDPLEFIDFLPFATAGGAFQKTPFPHPAYPFFFESRFFKYYRIFFPFMPILGIIDAIHKGEVKLFLMNFLFGKIVLVRPIRESFNLFLRVPLFSLSRPSVGGRISMSSFYEPTSTLCPPCAHPGHQETSYRSLFIDLADLAAGVRGRRCLA